MICSVRPSQGRCVAVDGNTSSGSVLFAGSVGAISRPSATSPEALAVRRLPACPDSGAAGSRSDPAGGLTATPGNGVSRPGMELIPRAADCRLQPLSDGRYLERRIPPHSAGDIASCSSTGDEATAELLDSLMGTSDSRRQRVRERNARGVHQLLRPRWGRAKTRTNQPLETTSTTLQPQPATSRTSARPREIPPRATTATTSARGNRRPQHRELRGHRLRGGITTRAVATSRSRC